MRFRHRICVSIAVLAGALLSGPPAHAQGYGGYSTLGAGNTRPGNNGNAPNSSPGLSNLNWFAPFNINTTSFLKPIIDNTDTNPPSLSPPADDGGPYQANPYGFTTTVGPWFAPPDPNGVADQTYDEAIRNQPITVGTTTYNINYDFRTPAYLMAQCVPAANQRQPWLGATAAFTWNFTGVPVNGNKVPATYSIWVNIPSGPTYNYTVSPATATFPQEFYVFAIRYGPNQSYVYYDVVDTYLSGGGWVRLGLGGLPNNVVFPYDGQNNITVTLFNTVPFTPTGVLSMPTPVSQFVVYADAVRFDPTPGYSYSTPVATRLTDTDPTTTIVAQANNELTVGNNNGVPTTLAKGVLTEYPFNGTSLTTGLPSNWRYSPLEEGPVPISRDSTTANIAGFAADPTAKTYSGSALEANIVPFSVNQVPSATVTYSPPVTASITQTYDIYAYIPGGLQYAQGTYYEVNYDNGAGAMITDFIPINQQLPTGWTRIGVKRYPNTASVPLSLVVTNISNNPADGSLTPPALAYTDAVRFIGEANHTITSTPAQAAVNITGIAGLTKVTVMADENGVIHCLDAKGNPDGTTTEYWSYPSLRDANGIDPNLGDVGANGPDYGGNSSIPGAQRVSTAEMPQGFGLSSPMVVQLPSGQFVCIVGSVNGRVYEIDMAGRGDYGSRSVRSGTTTRVWTYPATYPSPHPIATSDLISIPGSISYGTPNGVPTVYVPTQEGRIYSLTAVFNPNDASTSFLNWTFPLKNQLDPTLNQPNVGSILMSPLVAYNVVYFGCQQQQTVNGTNPGRFFSINWQTGKEIQETNFAAFVPPNTQTGTYPQYIVPLDFISSPATASNADLNPTTSTDQTAGLIYVLNQNGVVYGIDSGSLAVQWATDELLAGSQGGLTFTWQTVYDNNGAQNPFPVVMVPTSDGSFSSLFARPADINIDSGRLAWRYDTQGDSVVASMAVQDQGTIGTIPPTPNGLMYGADTSGYLYAFSNAAGGNFPFGQPGGNDIVPNNPAGDVFHKVRIAVLNSAPNPLQNFQALRQSPTAVTYAQADLLAGPDATVPTAANNGFEWGQTIYVMVYRFPFLTQNSTAQSVDPPVVNISLSVNGKVVRGVSVQARRFAGTSPNLSTVFPVGLPAGALSDPPLDGYAVLAFPFQSSGANSLPPGAGEIDATISTSALNGNGIQQNVMMSPTTGAPGSGRYPFIVANPLAIVVPPPSATLSTTPAQNALTSFLAQPNAPLYTFGTSTNPTDKENIANGSYTVPGSGKQGALIGASTPDLVQHGGDGKLIVWVIDRSMMSLLRPDGLTQGLDNVRVDRTDAAWQGGLGAVIKPLSTSYYAGYAGFEDAPVNYPNDSLDYPDIHKQNILATKDPAGSPENPLFNGVTLLPPLDITDPANPVALSPSSTPAKRLFRPTPFEVDLNVPRFQPANLNGSDTIANSAGAINPIQGYMGRFDVFVDSVPNGRLDTSVSEAYRSMNLSTSVDIDERLSFTTPTVDLGSLPSGAGYSAQFLPGSGFNQGSTPGNNVFQPWGGGAYAAIFQPFGVENDGNTNLLDLRLEKIQSFPNSGTKAEAIGSTDNDMSAYLDASFDLWTNLDPVFSAGPDTNHRVFLQKARVQDRVPTTLLPNPVRRVNQNLGTTGTVVVNGVTIPDALNQDMVGGVMLYDPTAKINLSPRIGVSLPIGFPVGKYSSQFVRVFENDNGDLAPGTNTPLWDDTTLGNSGAYTEPYTEAGMTLSFNVVETRLTNTYSNNAEQLIDSLTPGGANGQFENTNIQPTAARDALGSMLVAWSSNRPGMNASINSTETNQYLLYIAALHNAATLPTNQGSGITGVGGTSPLRDLDSWTPANNTAWFSPIVQGYPNVAAGTLFGLGANESLVPNSVRYGNPSFPSLGAVDPFNPGNYFNGLYMPFTGEVQRNNADGSVQRESRLFMASVTSSGASNLEALHDDRLLIKGKASVVETGKSNTSALVFYPVTGGGQTSILYTASPAPNGVQPDVVGGSFAAPSALPFGGGFLSVDAPSAVGRIENLGRTTQQNVVELSFAGKLRGRPYAEIYMGRLMANGAGTDLIRDNTGAVSANAFIDLPQVGNEQLTPEGPAGLYHSNGVDWDRNQPTTITQILGGVSTNILITGTGVLDNDTGLVSFDTTLGGKVFLDPSIGTVRFSNAIPSGNAHLFLTYTPKFLRVSKSTGGAAGYGSPSVLFDTRLISDPTYWVAANGSPATLATQEQSGNLLSFDRMIFTYNKGAALGTGAQPFMTSMRFGIGLPYRLPTLTSGQPGLQIGNNVASSILSITYADGLPGDALQLDPSGMALYFPAADEGRTITVVQYALDSAGNVIVDGGGNPQTFSTTSVISLIPERTEAPVPIETSINETGLTAFIDPFTYSNASPSGVPQSRRPPLLYFIWSSSRFGAPDLFLEGYAPLWTPTPAK